MTKLVEYLELCQQISSARDAASGFWGPECDRLNGAATERLSTVERIVRSVTPQAPTPLMPPSYSSSDSEQYVRRAVGALRDQAEVEANLIPDAPSLAADGLHPNIWAPASSIWETGQFAAAIQGAAIALSAHIQQKAGSKLRDGKLAAQVFSTELPKTGQPRLHFPGRDQDDDTWMSRQRGLHLLAQGAFAGIRNLVSHEVVDLTESEALEQMAVLSMIARWVDDTELTETS